MPEYQVELKVNFYAEVDDEVAVSRDLATMLFADDCVNSIEGGVPLFVAQDDE